MNNQFRITCYPHEIKMTHWIFKPVVENLRYDTTVLNPGNVLWDLCSVEESTRSIKLTLRKYPGTSNHVQVEFFPDDIRSCFLNDKKVPVDHLKTELDKITG